MTFEPCKYIKDANIHARKPVKADTCAIHQRFNSIVFIVPTNTRSSAAPQTCDNSVSPRDTIVKCSDDFNTVSEYGKKRNPIPYARVGRMKK